MLLFAFLQEKSRLSRLKTLLLLVPRMRLTRTSSNRRYTCRTISACRRRPRGIDQMLVMLLRDCFLVTRSHWMRMAVRNPLRSTLTTPYRCAGRRASGRRSSDMAPSRTRKCDLLVFFGTLYPGLCFEGRRAWWNLCVSLVSCTRADWLITCHSAVGACLHRCGLHLLWDACWCTDSVSSGV